MSIDKIAKYLNEIGGILTWSVVLGILVTGIVIGFRWIMCHRRGAGKAWSWEIKSKIKR